MKERKHIVAAVLIFLLQANLFADSREAKASYERYKDLYSQKKYEEAIAAVESAAWARCWAEWARCWATGVDIVGPSSNDWDVICELLNVAGKILNRATADGSTGSEGIFPEDVSALYDKYLHDAE